MLITKVKISNFMSIGEEVELSFLKGGKTPQEGYFQYKEDEKISLINGFYGANASGKSNILRAIILLIRLIYFPPQNFSREVPFLFPNFHNRFSNTSSKLGIDFLFGKNHYSYDIEIKHGKEILSERLLFKNLEVKGSVKEIFSRIGNTITFGKDYSEYSEYPALVKIQNYQTFMSHFVNNVGATAVADFIDNKDNFFLKSDDVEIAQPTFVSVMNRALNVSNLPASEKTKTLESLTKLMNCFNPSIIGTDINNENNNLSIKIEHKDFSKKVDLMQESAGTREMFFYMLDILNVFKKGGVVVYDETNRYYHPDVELVLLSIFVKKEFNEKNSQLIFSSHNHETFDLLMQDQVHIVEKKDDSTSVFSLDEVADLQKRDNIKKRYRLGMFGGVPDITDLEYSLKQML